MANCNCDGNSCEGCRQKEKFEETLNDNFPDWKVEATSFSDLVARIETITKEVEVWQTTDKGIESLKVNSPESITYTCEELGIEEPQTKQDRDAMVVAISLEMDSFKEAKNKIVRQQKYEEAANLRTAERSCQKKIATLNNIEYPEGDAFDAITDIIEK